MPKKKVFAARNLKDCLPNLPLETGKSKKKIKVFLSRQFCASLAPFTVTLIIFGESVMWRRRHYLFRVAETGGGII